MTASTTQSDGLDQICEKHWLPTQGLLKQSDPKRSEYMASNPVRALTRKDLDTPPEQPENRCTHILGQDKERAPLIKEGEGGFRKLLFSVRR